MPETLRDPAPVDDDATPELRRALLWAATGFVLANTVALLSDSALVALVVLMMLAIVACVFTLSAPFALLSGGAIGLLSFALFH